MAAIFLSSILASSGCLEETDYEETYYEDANNENNSDDWQNNNEKELILSIPENLFYLIEVFHLTYLSYFDLEDKFQVVVEPFYYYVL